MSKLRIENGLREGAIIREPIGDGAGYWAGAPGWVWDETDQATYLTYRIRRPRGIEPDRGGESRIAKSTDLQNWEDIWSVHKNEYNSASIEKSTLHRGPDGGWVYFTSFVAPEDGRWCVEFNKTDSIEKLNSANSKRIFTATELNLEGVKDPWVMQADGIYYLFLSVAKSTAETSDNSHDTLDIFNTGECVSATALATSTDLEQWDWHGIVLEPEGDSWDCYCRRINSVLPLDGKYFAFYDGSAGHHENYEERTGLTMSDDLRNWKVLTPDGPCATSEHATGSLRYIDAQRNGGEIICLHELTRADGAHEMRMARFGAADFSLE